MKQLMLVICMASLLGSLLSISVSGDQSGTWSTENNPYILVGDVTVPSGLTLSINAGVIVQSQGNYQINVLGMLTATGTPSDSIHFGITTDNTALAWKGLRFENSLNASEVKFCDIRSAENGINSIATPLQIEDNHFYANKKGINCYGISTENPPQININRCFIEYSKENGIFIVEHKNVLITNCDISNNGVNSSYRAAIQLSIQSTGADCSPRIENNHIHHNRWQGITGWDITALGIMQPVIRENIIEYNYTGIYLLNADGQVMHNQINHNFIEGNMNSGAGIMVSGVSSTPVFYHNTVTGNYTGFYLAGNANPCIGDLSEDVLTYWGRNTISDNIDANGILHSIYLYQYTNSAILIKAENNFWGTSDTLVIAQSIMDHADNSSLGTVDYMPLGGDTPLQSISGTITPLEGMLGCEIRATPVDDPLHSVITTMNADYTYQIPLEEPGMYYVTATGYRFEDISPTLCGAYPAVYEPAPVNVFLLSQVENINIEMQDFPPYMYARIGNSFQSDNHTIFPYEQGLFVTSFPVLVNLYDDGTNIRIHSFTNQSFTPPITVTLTSNDILLPKNAITPESTWNSSRMIYMEDTWEWQLIPVSCTVIGQENVLYIDLLYPSWIIETRTQGNELISKEWYALNLGIIKGVYYQGNFLTHKKTIQHALVQQDETYAPICTGNRWFYAVERPEGPTNLICMPGDATNFFSWEPTTAGEIPWTHYKFYEDGTVLATLPIEQTQYGVLQDFLHTHHYYVTAWREGAESIPSNTITIEGVGNQDDTNTPLAAKLSVYPNPCSITTSPIKIGFELNASQPVQITIYNLRGQKVKSLCLDKLVKGKQELAWDGVDDSGQLTASGVYLMRLDVGNKKLTQKMVIIK